jgi:hypothetical protein
MPSYNIVNVNTDVELKNTDFRSGAANPGPAGHFWPARTFKMAREEFLADTG